MTAFRWAAATTTLAGLLVLTAADGLGQPPDQKDFFQKKGFGPFGGGERKVVKDHDKDGNGRLNKDERVAAREALK
ncbi:MAG TPA: hypothetical protein VM597_41355, partial [Gemmataceae bacterium]|nr:hypothetical protein [Gemmataceae bacterium]